MSNPIVEIGAECLERSRAISGSVKDFFKNIFLSVFPAITI
jgi:hypothetical protein